MSASGAQLLLALGLLTATGLSAALQLRLASFGETLLAGYVIGWSWLVVLTMALSIGHRLSASWYWPALLIGALAGVVTCFWRGVQPFADPRPHIRHALRDGPVAVLSVSVAAGSAYATVIAFGVAPNAGDSLAYHISRALLWRQQHAVEWIPGATDLRLNAMAPTAEIGQLAAILVTEVDRFVAVGQLLALGATMLAVATLARRLGASVRGAVFSALLFGSLPVVILQASTALNDLVLCSFLACAAVLLLSEHRLALFPAALATALAVGTKLSALLGIPLLVALAVMARPPTYRRSLLTIGAGAVLGSWWYWVVLGRTGRLDGGLADEFDQGSEHSVAGMVTTARRLLFDVLDRSGVDGRDVRVFLLCSGIFLVASLVAGWRGRGNSRALLFGGILVAVVPVLLAPVGYHGLRAWQKLGTSLGRHDLAFGGSTEWSLSTVADAVDSWYGPVLPVCLVAAPLALLVGAGRGHHRGVLLFCSVAPAIAIAELTVTLAYDPFRGRLVMFSVALAAVSWSAARRWPSVVWGLTGLATVSLAMSLAMSQAAPSGLILFEDREGPISRASIWGKARTEQQGQLRPDVPELSVIRFFDSQVPMNASVALATRPNDFLAPYFGERLERRVTLLEGVDPTRLPRADWLVVNPESGLAPCPDDWRTVARSGDWKVYRRVGRGSCTR